MAKSVTTPIYQVKVTLTEVKPTVWRRLLVPSSISLTKFHDILQIAFGWTDAHLHEFEAGGMTYGTPHSEYPNTTRNEARVRLDQVLLEEKDSMFYQYDFGDGWVHKIVVEKVLTSRVGLKAPSCIGGKGACPPEDCGGPPGYARFLEAVRDPENPEHEDMVAWIGGDFDPSYFDPWEINEELAEK